NGIAGHELGPLLHEQAEVSGAEFLLDIVEGIDPTDGHHIVRCGNASLRARTVIVASGSSHRRLGVPGEERLLGRGVSNCASCDGPLFRDKSVCVVGGGDSALDEALVLTNHASAVTIIHRGTSLDSHQALREQIAKAGGISVLYATTVEEIVGDQAVAV